MLSFINVISCEDLLFHLYNGKGVKDPMVTREGGSE
jgi:hypothetical protein